MADDAKDRVEALPPAYSLRQTDPAVAADMGPRPGRSPPERDALQIRQ